MRIGKIRHRGLCRFYEDDDPSRLPAASVPRIRNMLAALVFADRPILILRITTRGKEE